jgi:hypothetical protein
MFKVGDIVQCTDAAVSPERTGLIVLGHLYVIVEEKPNGIRAHVRIARQD